MLGKKDSSSKFCLLGSDDNQRLSDIAEFPESPNSIGSERDHLGLRAWLFGGSVLEHYAHDIPYLMPLNIYSSTSISSLNIYRDLVER